MKLGELSIGDKFYICRTGEKGFITGEPIRARVPVTMTYSLSRFKPSDGHTFNIQTKVKHLK